MHVLHVEPAYGRTYSTIKAVREDWKSGKDFKIIGGPYINLEDYRTFGEGKPLVFSHGQMEFYLNGN